MAVIKNISYSLASSVLSKPLGFLLSLILAKSLGPSDYGVWVTLMLIISYCPIAHLGTLETLIKEVAHFFGKGDSARIKLVESSVLGFVTLSAIFVASLAFLTPLIHVFTSYRIDTLLVIVMLFTAATTFLTSYYYYRATAYQDFKFAAAMDFLRAVLALLFVGGMVWCWGLVGAVVGYFTHELVMCIVTRHLNVKEYGSVRMNFRRDLLFHAVSVGLPITLLWWVLTLSGTVDRVVMGGFLTAADIGHYALGLSLVTLLNMVPLAVGRVLYPKVNHYVGGGGDVRSINDLVLVPSLALATLLVNLQMLLLVIMPFIYNVLLPKYRLGLVAGQILMLGSFFGCLLRNGANYLIAVNQERIFLKYIVATLASNIVFDIVLIKMGMGIAGIALGTSLAGFCLTTLVWRRVLSGLKFDYAQRRKALALLYLPIVLLIGLVVASHFAFPMALTEWTGRTVAVCMGMLLCVNGALYCTPVYQQEMRRWNTEILTYSGVLMRRLRKMDVSP